MSEEWRGPTFYFARSYIDLQKMRIGCELRIRKIIEHYTKIPKGAKFKTVASLIDEIKDDEAKDIALQLLSHRDVLKKEEDSMLDRASKIFKDTMLWNWVERVKGLSKMAALMFLGYINPFIASNPAKVWKYWGLAPGEKIKSGEKSGYNPLLKGRGWLIAGNVIRAGDEYYVPLYRAKKEYFLNNERRVKDELGRIILFPPFMEIIKDPKLCPRYVECEQKRVGKARRLGESVKKPACKAHVDSMAKIWLAKIILSHAWELIRREEGLKVGTHYPYIPPKPADPEECKRILDDIIPKILKGERL
ncbi:MAG: hypothetical protein QW618_03880 [Nitrososphaerales archaeon]